LGRRSTKCRRVLDGGGGGATSRWARGVNPATVREAVGEVPTWTWRRSGRQLMRHRRGPDGGGGVNVVEEQAHGWRRNDTAKVRV
jgi:hypothetical protein